MRSSVSGVRQLDDVLTVLTADVRSGSSTAVTRTYAAFHHIARAISTNIHNRNNYYNNNNYYYYCHLWPLYRTTCISRHPRLTSGGFCWSKGQEGKLSGLFCAVLCATIVHYELHTHMNRANSSLDWILSHWAHFTVLRFICVYVLFCV